MKTELITHDAAQFRLITTKTAYLDRKAKEDTMSMRGQIISREYQSMKFVNDKDGKEYACYLRDLKDFDEKKGLTDRQKAKCLDTSVVMGDSW